MKWKEVSKLLFEQVSTYHKGVVPLKDYDPEQASLCEEAWVEGSGVMEERDIRKWMWDKRKVLEGSLLVVAKQDEDSWVLAACK